MTTSEALMIAEEMEDTMSEADSRLQMTKMRVGWRPCEERVLS